ncbi:hypothetical protein S245_037847, partial [Arachis hypogaea]
LTRISSQSHSPASPRVAAFPGILVVFWFWDLAVAVDRSQLEFFAQEVHYWWKEEGLRFGEKRESLFLVGFSIIVGIEAAKGFKWLLNKLNMCSGSDEPSKELPKFSVKLFLHFSGHVAVKFQYDQVIISAFRRIPRASWNAKERLWMFPLSSLSEAEKLEVVKDKIKSPKSKDESESLKFTQKNLINK